MSHSVPANRAKTLPSTNPQNAIQHLPSRMSGPAFPLTFGKQSLNRIPLITMYFVSFHPWKLRPTSLTWIFQTHPKLIDHSRKAETHNAMKQILKQIDRIFLSLLQAIASAILKKYKPRIVAVTGTVGKTSAKEAIYLLLREGNKNLWIYRSPKSFNGEWGVPLSITMRTSGYDDFFSKIGDIVIALRLFVFKQKYPDILILEMGVNKPGEISRIAKWIRIDILVITTISDDSPHLDEFKKPELVIEEKSSLIRSLHADGALILNTDDPHSQYFINNWSGRTIFYGFNNDADILATDYKIQYEKSQVIGFTFLIVDCNCSCQIRVRGCVGIQHVYPILIATTVAIIFGFEMNKNFLFEYQPPPGRMRILKGRNCSILIDDSFNASPIAVLEAISTLQMIETKRKVVALSYLLGLEDREKLCHLEISEYLERTFDLICLVGLEWEEIFHAAECNKMLLFRSSLECGEYLKTELHLGDVVLIKGSQSSRMERVTGKLLSDEYKKSDVLVRQEDYWLKIN